MSTDSSPYIEITHVINPHLFWFKYKDKQNAEVERIERALKKYVAELGDELPTAELAGDKYQGEKYVTVYMKSKEKWIRAEVDDATSNENESIIWAVDYGLPLKKSLEAIVLLSEELKNLCCLTESAVNKGGIAGILPVKRRVTVNIIFYFTFFYVHKFR